MTNEDLEAWRDSPVTQLMLGNLSRAAALRKRLILEAFWEGKSLDPEEVAQAKAEIAILDDLTGSTLEDIISTKEQIDEAEYEQERNEANQPERLGQAGRG